MSIYLVQCLCPARHAILAVALEAGNDTTALAQVSTHQQIIESAFRRGTLNRHCGICGSPELHYELARTRFTSVQDAKAGFAHESANQMLTRIALDAAGLTHDSKRMN